MEKSKTVFVTVGTTKFDLLIETVCSESVCKTLKNLGYELLKLQIGSGKHEPMSRNLFGVDVESYDYKQCIKEDIASASLVISHAGAGTLLETLTAGKPLITVINDTLMDNHQVELANEMFKHRHSLRCTCSTLIDTLHQLNDITLQPFVPGDPKKFASFLDGVMGFV